jgi:transposase
MRREHFIALDMHCAFCEMAVMTSGGRVTERRRLNTTIPELAAALDAVPRPKRLTFEEGPLADWLTRNLTETVDELVVCEPRRNRLIAKSSDKDDPLDAERLADLFRGGYLKPVHQSQTLERSLLKQHVSYYHDRVRDRVRLGNQALGLLRRHGVFVSASDLVDQERQAELLDRLPDSRLLRGDVQRLFASYEFLMNQEDENRRELVQAAREHDAVRRFERVPGFGWIRAATFFVYVDTPHRFPSVSTLWRYCGIGLERRHSGAGPTKVRLASRGHRRLKDVLLGAAKSAIASANNPYADKYEVWRNETGLAPTTARRNVARALAATLWSLWKSGGEYDPARVGRPKPTPSESARDEIR